MANTSMKRAKPALRRKAVAPAGRSPVEGKRAAVPKVGFVSLGCPKALVDSERIITRLRAEGYQIARDYAGADVNAQAANRDTPGCWPAPAAAPPSWRRCWTPAGSTTPNATAMAATP